MAEWFKAAVLKTVDGETRSGGSNPSSSAIQRFVRPGDMGNRMYLRHR